MLGEIIGEMKGNVSGQRVTDIEVLQLKQVYRQVEALEEYKLLNY